MTNQRPDPDMTAVVATPGQLASISIPLHHAKSATVDYSLRIVGLDAVDSPAVGGRNTHVRVGPDATLLATVDFLVPATLGVGQHAAAIEVTADRSDIEAELIPIILVVESIDNVVLSARPSPIRAGRRTSFQLDIANLEPVPVELLISGSAPDVNVQPRQQRFSLASGQRASTKIKVRGPRQWRTDPIQHNLVISGQGRSSTTAISVPYVQRALVGFRLRAAVAAVTVLCLIVGAFYVDWPSFGNDNPTDAGIVVDADGDGIPDDAVDLDGDGRPDMLVDADGDGVYDPLLDASNNPVEGTGGGFVRPGAGVDADGDGFIDPALDANGQPIPGTGGTSVLLFGSGVDANNDGVYDPLTDANGTPIPGTGGAPVNPGDPFAQSTDGIGDLADGTTTGDLPTELEWVGYSGTVTAAGSNVSGVKVHLSSISLAETQTPEFVAARAASSAGSGGQGGFGGFDPAVQARTKIWSARFANLPRELNPIRQTEALEPAYPTTSTPDEGGVFKTQQVPRRQSYELLFAKKGFDVQSFIVTPPEQGSPAPIDVELQPATGRLAGNVTGPSGALGGVSIMVTDGTLIFETTTATQANADANIEVGDWSLGDLSTPATYTVIAELDGFGREVVQVPLDEGATNSNVDLVLRPGVGSLAGTVRLSGNGPLGGVTITASNGAVSRSTTSFTASPIGRYDLPQLPVPGTYTITAELDGYITSSSQIDLRLDDANRVRDILMIPTTQGLSGRVLIEDQPGVGINAAVITMQKGDLVFRTQSGPSPLSGSFDIENLPPGDYVVTAEADRHDTESTFVTIEEGVQEPALEFKLTPNDTPVALEPSMIQFEMSDATDGTNIDEIVVEGLTPNPTTLTNFGEAIPVAPGTYIITIKSDGYRDFGPFRASVGPGQTLPIMRSMQQAGDATGRVVDITDPNIVLTNYSLVLREVVNINGDLGDRRVNTVVTADGFWESSPPRQLTPGTWQLEFGEKVRGYEVFGQRISPDPLARDLQIVVPREGEAQVVEVPDILAVPYPELSGRILKPRLDSNDVTQFDPIDHRDLKVWLQCSGGGLSTDSPPVRIPSFAVPLTRPDDADDEATLLDDEGDQDGSLYDSFVVPKEIVDDEDLDCAGPETSNGFDNAQARGENLEVVIEADGFVTRTETFANVVVGDVSNPNTDRLFNIAVHRDVNDFGGTIFWTDYGTPTPTQVKLDDVSITARTPITDFVPTDDGSSSDPGLVDLVNLTKDTELGGRWVFPDTTTVNQRSDPRQLFGVTTYSFDVDNFGETNVELTIDETDGPEITSSAGVRLVNDDLNNLQLDLMPPDPGTITGEITILTTDPDGPNYALPMTVDRPAVPAGSTPGQQVGPTANNGNFRFQGVDPGTWTINFADVDNHEFRAPTLPGTRPDAQASVPPSVPTSSCNVQFSCVTGRLDPGDDPLDGFNATLVERGTVDLVLISVDENGNDVDIVGRDGIELVLQNAIYPDASQTFNAGDGTTADPNRYSLDNIAVHDTSPASTSVAYDASLTLPGFDATSVVITDISPAWNPTPLLNTVHTDNVTIDLGTLNVRAGSKLVLEVRVEPYGQLVGTVRTKTSHGTPDLISTDDLAGLEIVAVRERDLFGNPVANVPEPGFGRNSTNGTFSIDGPPGYYTITVSHPKYNDVLVGLPATTTSPPSSTGEPALGNVYLLQNRISTTLAPDYVLDLRRGSLELTALTDAPFITYLLRSPTLVGRTGIDPERGVAFDPASDVVYGLLNTDGSTATIRRDDLYPGSYELEIRGYDVAPIGEPGPTGQTRFPAIVAGNNAPLVDIVPEVRDGPESLTRVTATLAARGATITGTILARNKSGNADPVELPTNSAGEVTSNGIPALMVSDYAAPEVIVGGNPVTNDAPDPTGKIVLSSAPLDPPIYRYTLNDVGDGVHDISAPSIPGYTLRTTLVQPIIVPDVLTGPTFIYEADDTDIFFELTSTPDALYTNLKVTITTPGGTPTSYTLTDDDGVPLTATTGSFATATNVVTIRDIAPEVGDFTIRVESGLHDPSTMMVPVPVDVDADGEELPDLAMTGTRTRLRIRVEQNDGTPVPHDILTAPGTVTLEPFGAGETITLTGGQQEDDGFFEFRTAADSLDPLAGSYTVSAAHPGGGNVLPFESSPKETITLRAGTELVADTIVLAQYGRVKLVFAPVTGAFGDIGNPRPRLVDVDTIGPGLVKTTYPPVAESPYQFDVPPGFYSVEFAADNYPNIVVSTTDIEVNVGEDPGLRPAISLPRVVQVNLTGSTTATVKLEPSDGPSFSKQQTGSQLPVIYTFRSDLDGIPTIGVFEITGKRGQRSDPNYLFGEVVPSPPEALGTIVDLNIAQPPTATVFGQLTFADGTRYTSDWPAIVLTAVPTVVGGLDPGDEPPTQIDATFFPTDADVDYEIDGLTTTGLNKHVRWTITMQAVNGVGELTSTGGRVIINMRDTDDLTGRRNKDLVITPRDVDVEFSLTAAPGQKLSGVTMQVGTRSSSTLVSTDGDVTGTVTVEDVPENALATGLEWQISGVTNQVTEVPAADRRVPALTSGSPARVTLPQLSTTIARVRVIEGSDPVDDATVTLCLDPCVTPISSSGTVTDGTYRFTGLDGGVYDITASRTVAGVVSTNAGTDTLTANANGTPATPVVPVTITPP